MLLSLRYLIHGFKSNGGGHTPGRIECRWRRRVKIGACRRQWRSMCRQSGDSCHMPDFAAVAHDDDDDDDDDNDVVGD